MLAIRWRATISMAMPRLTGLMADQYGLRRLFLHAHSLNLPLGGREIAVSAPLDAELKAVLDQSWFGGSNRSDM